MSESTLKNRKYAISGIVISAFFAVVCILMAGWTQVYISKLLAYAGFNTFLFSLLIFNYYRLKYKAEIEEEEQEEVRNSAGASQELFDESDEALMLSARALKSWNRYFLPTVTLIYGLGGLAYLITKWISWVGNIEVDPKIQMAASACAGALGVCYFLIGAFFGGASKQRGGIGLRAFSAWSYFSAIVCVAVMAVLFFSGAEYPELDKLVSRVFLVIFMLLAFELSLNFLVDMYRPRFHTEEKSILESRFLSIFTDSGSIASNIAHALDYQFGVQVTEESFYRFLKKVVLPLLLIMVGTLYLLSCFTLIEIGHRGLKESFGKVNDQQELSPNLYIHLPYPFQRIHTFPADKISDIRVGLKPKVGEDMPEEPGEEQEVVTVTEDIVLWTKPGHHMEGMEDIKYLITTRETENPEDAVSTNKVNLITTLVPIQYKIKTHEAGKPSPLFNYLFKHADAEKLLNSIASEAVMKYCSKSDYYDFLGKDREVAAKVLTEEIQAQADKYELGVEIVALAFEFTHPPGDVSKSYGDVMSAEYDQDRSRFEARIKEINTLSESSIKTKNIIAAAEGETAAIEYKNAEGEVEKVPMKLAIAIEKAIRMKTQNESFKVQPYLFYLVNYLSVLEEGLQDSKLVIIDSDKADYNFQFDLKPKTIPDFEGLEIPEAN